MVQRNYFTFALDGVDDLIKAFDELPKAVARNVLIDICNKAAQPIVATAKSLAADDPDNPGSLRNSIGVKKWRGPKWAGVIIGPRWPEGAHGHLVEFGTGPRFLDSGKYVGSMPAQPFMRPAWDAHKAAALTTLREEVWASLAKAARSLRKRAEKGTLGRSARRQLGGF